MKSYVIPKIELLAWIERLIKENEVVAPIKKENFTSFLPIASSRQIVWGAPQTVIPPKAYLYPQSEELLTYEFSGQGPKVQGKNLTKPRVLFGVHPCDLNAIFLMDKVWAEKNPDENYLQKRQALTLVGVDCLKPCAPQAICLRMDGLNPRDRFDIFLTDLGDNFIAEVATPKGEALLKGIGKETRKDEAKEIRKQRDALFDREELPLKPKYVDLPKLLKENYAHPVFEEHGKKCYGCGSCNMVCPTCYCFDVQDYMHVSLARGERKRVWDGCMLDDFAKVASGENFREDRRERLRHRTYRKLFYLYEKWGQSFCTGCGRCIKACLTNIVSPLEIANQIHERKIT
ncbi:MAG: 4Fe-4S dicluster domain-containing protein [Candidatus Margulisiibacteriota bacterium]